MYNDYSWLYIQIREESEQPEQEVTACFPDFDTNYRNRMNNASLSSCGGGYIAPKNSSAQGRKDVKGK